MISAAEMVEDVVRIAKQSNMGVIVIFYDDKGVSCAVQTSGKGAPEVLSMAQRANEISVRLLNSATGLNNESK